MMESVSPTGSPRSNRLKWMLLAGISSAVGGGSYLAVLQWNGPARAEDVAPEPAPAPVPVEVVPAIRGEVTASLSSASTLEAEQSAQVLAKVSGIVTAIDVREGSTVREGERLAQIDDEEKRLALERAVLTLKKAEAEFQRATLSFDQQLISKFDYEKTLFDRDLAESERQRAELEFRYTEVKAPFSGKVTLREIVVGKTVQPGDALFTLADFDTLVVKLFLPEKDVLRLEPGQTVRLVPEAQADRAGENAFFGRIRDVSPIVDPKTGTIKVTVAVTESGSNARPGAFVRAEIETDRRTDAVLVPKSALIQEDGRTFVFVARSGRAERRAVEVGYSRAAAVQILDGVEKGEEVIVAGQTTLADGDAIEILRER